MLILANPEYIYHDVIFKRSLYSIIFQILSSLTSQVGWHPSCCKEMAIYPHCKGLESRGPVESLCYPNQWFQNWLDIRSSHPVSDLRTQKLHTGSVFTKTNQQYCPVNPNAGKQLSEH